MMNRTAVLASLVLGLAGAGTGRSATVPGSDFRLPQGDVASGKKVFQELRCHACHAVAGQGFPAPVAQPPVPALLGGSGQRAMTDADLVVAIVDPSHFTAPAGPGSETRSGTLSRMGDFNESMTVRQLIDLVAFVKSLRPTAPPVRPKADGK
jgi:mono/diheme cytochrome c family protein